jgi:hypothetical protein
MSSFFMLSFDIESLDIVSSDIESFDMLSFFIESLDIESFDIVSFFMESLDIESFDIVSFCMVSSAKAVDASASPNDKVAADRIRAVCLIIAWKSPGKAFSGLSPSKTSNEAVACYAPGKGIDHKSVNDSGCARSNLRRMSDLARLLAAHGSSYPSKKGRLRGAASANRGGMELPVPGTDRSRSPSAPGKVEQAGPRHGVESLRTAFRLFGDRPNKAGELARNRGGDHGLQLPLYPSLRYRRHSPL